VTETADAEHRDEIAGSGTAVTERVGNLGCNLASNEITATAKVAVAAVPVVATVTSGKAMEPQGTVSRRSHYRAMKRRH
jgi:hypothetical protein